MSYLKMKQYLMYLLILISSGFLLSACGSGDINDLIVEEEIEQSVVDASGNYAGDVVIDIVETIEDSPKIFQPIDGKTNVVVQFIPRDNNGFPLSSEQIEVELKIDGEDISSESHIESSATELQFNVNFGLVLDASYSMVDREAFTPMLNAASQSVQSGIDIWETNSGEFNFYTTWFNDFIFSADNTNNPWVPEDIKSIAPPVSNVNSSTKLFAAVDFMVDKLNALPTADKPEDAPADQNIILVFSDGKDEFSWYDNAATTVIENNVTDNGAEYTKIGYKAIDLDDNLIPNIAQSEDLAIHVIGLGETIVEDDLRKIAQAGHGTFRKNPDNNDLKTVFDRVVQEFTTLQTHGARLSREPGEYTFTLRVNNKSGNKFAEYSFNFIIAEEVVAVPENP